MGRPKSRPKSRQAPRTTMSIRVSERERRQIEEKAMATGLAASAYIRTMALDDGNVDTTIHEDRQKLMHELSACEDPSVRREKRLSAGGERIR